MCIRHRSEKVYFLWTRHLHLQRLACSHDTICLTSGLQAGGEEGHACSLKNSREPGDTARKPVMYLSEPISTQQESSRSVVKRGGWRRWGHRGGLYYTQYVYYTILYIYNIHIIYANVYLLCIYIYISVLSAFHLEAQILKLLTTCSLLKYAYQLHSETDCAP